MKILYSNMKKAVLLDPQFWAAVIAGWIVYSLLLENKDLSKSPGDSLQNCSPCASENCQTCSKVEKSTKANSMPKNEFYRKFPWKPQDSVEDELSSWKMESKKHRDGMQNEDPRVGINGMWRLEREQVENFIKYSAKNIAPSFSDGEVTFKRLIRKYDPFFGVSYIANVERSRLGSLSNTSAHEVGRKFTRGKPSLIDIKRLDEKEFIHIITPLSKVTERFHKFLKRLEENIYSTRKESFEKLIFVIFGDRNDDDAAKTVAALQAFQLRNPRAIMRHTFVDGDFNRAIGIDTGVRMCPDKGLMLFLDVDLSITPEFLSRIRGNTVQNKRVVFPIMFSQFDPEIIQTYMKTAWVPPPPESSGNPIGDDKGFWIYYAFGVASMYKSDYHSVGGFPLDIVGWGGEDVALFKKLIASPSLDVMSTVDPDLIHIYHSRSCDIALSPDQYRMCIGSLSETIGSQIQVGTLYLKNKNQNYFNGEPGN